MLGKIDIMKIIKKLSYRNKRLGLGVRFVDQQLIVAVLLDIKLR
jgi:hypothetical protein